MNPKQFGALYHGTVANLRPGDVVQPRSGRAYATTDKRVAKQYASTAVNKTTGQGTLFGSVYEVEPVGDVTPPAAPIGQVTSTQGFRVNRHVGYVPTQVVSPREREAKLRRFK